MNETVKYMLDGQECNPDNAKDVSFVFNFAENRDKKELEIDVTALKFTGEDYYRIEAYREIWGDYYAMPLTIIYPDETTIKYLLDFSEEMLVEEGYSIEVNVKRYKGWDMFFKNADGLAFFDSNIGWTESDFSLIDYIVIPEDQKAILLSLSISIFALSKELAVSIDKLSQNTEALIKASVPVGAPPAPDWGAIIVASIRLAANIAYTVAIIVALIKLGIQLVEIVFPKVRQYKGIRYKKLIEKCVNYLGYDLESTLLDSLSGLTVLPKPAEADGKWWQQTFIPNTLAYTNGYPSVEDTIPTLGAALREFEKVTNSETRVSGNVVKIEKKSFFAQTATEQIKRTFNDQEALLNKYTINSGEIFKRLVVLYQTDPKDFNTYDDKGDTVAEASSELINSNDRDLELIKGYDELRINFSRGTRKNDLTWLEEAVKAFAKSLDTFTGGGLSSKIEARKGVMQLSSQYFTNTKLLYISGTKLAQNQDQFIGSSAIIQNHSDNFIQNNQKKLYGQMPLPLTWNKMFQFLSNNFVTLESGEVIELTKVAFNGYEASADIDYVRYKTNVNEKTLIL